MSSSVILLLKGALPGPEVDLASQRLGRVFVFSTTIIIIIIIINLFIQCRNITQNNLDVESWGGCANSTEKKINFEKLKRKQSKGKHGKIIKVKSY